MSLLGFQRLSFGSVCVLQSHRGAQNQVVDPGFLKQGKRCSLQNGRGQELDTCHSVQLRDDAFNLP